MGSTRLVTDSAGAVVGASAYTAFGTIATRTGVSTRIGYTGAWTDPDSGLVYLRARDYDPATGQFMTVDPAIDSTRQAYTYVRNRPTVATDPTGLCGDIPTPQVHCSDPGWFNDVLTSAPANFVGDLLRSGPTGDVATAVVGFGDGASFGISDWIRSNWLQGSTCTVNRNGFYTAGQVVGTVSTFADFGGAIASGVAKVGPIGDLFNFGAHAAERAAGVEGVTPQVIRAGDLKLPGVPKGAAGTLTNNGKRLIYQIPRGTPELDSRVAGIRVAGPVTSGKYLYPNGYVSYLNSGGQVVNPLTGETLQSLDPLWHIPLP